MDAVLVCVCESLSFHSEQKQTENSRHSEKHLCPLSRLEMKWLLRREHLLGLGRKANEI